MNHSEKTLADVLDGPYPPEPIDLDRRDIRLVACALLVFWLAVGCTFLVVTQ